MELLSAGKLFSLQRPIVSRLDRASHALLYPAGVPAVDFRLPAGEPAFADPGSVSWRIFKNPVSLFIGGVAAVILELAEPRVRSGVWNHSGFRINPVRRLRRTGLAAMITVYGPRSAAEAMIGNVRRMHERIRGVTPSGAPYAANDPELLNWVHATAAFGFAQAYHTYAAPLSAAECGRYYGEGALAAAHYGVTRTAGSEADVLCLFEGMRGRLEPSPILFEFLDIMRNAPVLPPVIRPLQPLFVRAAISLIPDWVRELLEIPDALGLRAWQGFLVKRAGKAADRIILESSPAVQSCLRMGLPADFLYSGGSRGRGGGGSPAGE